MNAFFPAILLTYLQPFRQLFSKPCFDYFKAFILTPKISIHDHRKPSHNNKVL